MEPPTQTVSQNDTVSRFVTPIFEKFLLPAFAAVAGGLLLLWLSNKYKARLLRKQLVSVAKDGDKKKNALSKAYQSLTSSLGPLTIKVHLLVGQVDAPFTFANLKCVRSREKKQLPNECESARHELVNHYKAEAVKRNAVFFDGPKYSLLNFRYEITDIVTEGRNLVLELGDTSYFDYVISNLSIDLPFIQSDKQFKTLRDSLRLDPNNPRELPLSNQLAINVNLITRDDQIVVQQRSGYVSNYVGELASGINASMTRGTTVQAVDELPDGAPSPFLTAIREASEEMGLRAYP